MRDKIVSYHLPVNFKDHSEHSEKHVFGCAITALADACVATYVYILTNFQSMCNKTFSLETCVPIATAFAAFFRSSRERGTAR